MIENNHAGRCSESAKDRSSAMVCPSFLDKLLAPKTGFWVLAAYFILQIGVRLWTSGAVDLDEAEQVLFTQQLQWGYGPQPPLYTWIQAGVFKLFGVSIFSLSLLKNSLLLFLFGFVYLAGRQVFERPSSAMIAALGLFFSSTISWECQRDLTHTVLVTTAAAATWHMAFSIFRRPVLSRYLGLGLCFALGTLSNYSYLVLWISLIVAMLLQPDTRRRVLCWPMAAALVVSIPLLLPHAWWAIQNAGIATMTSKKFKISDSSFSILAMIQVLGHLLRTLLSQIGLPLALFILLTGKPWRKVLSGFYYSRWPGQIQMAARMLGVMVVLICLATAILQVTKFKGRWFTPLLVPVPLILTATQLHRLTPRAERRFVGAVIVIMLAVSIGLPARVRFARWRSSSSLPTLNAPFAQLLSSAAVSLDPGTTLVAADGWLAGNIRLAAPHLRTLTPSEPGLRFEFDVNRAFLVWNATRLPTPPDDLIEKARRYLSVEPRSDIVTTAEASFEHWPDQRMRLGFLPLRLIPQ